MDPLVIAKKVLDCEAGRRQPASVLARFAGWQLWRRVFRKPLTFATSPAPSPHSGAGGLDSISGFWYQQLPDFEEMAFACTRCIRGIFSSTSAQTKADGA